jgi:WhiB family redox-sensing transcriptional regulator
MASSLPVQRLTDDALWARVAGQARCADSGLDPDQWYPVSLEPGRARHEAAAAIAVCTSCPVRAQCLELSLRHWDIGQHGVWGGLVATDRAHLRRRWPADHRGRRGTAVSGMIVRLPFPPVPLGLVQGGDAQ